MFTFHVTDMTEDGETLILTASGDVSCDDWRSLKPEARLLADSDNRMFVYLLENDEGFHHVKISGRCWNELEHYRQTGLPVFLVLEGKQEPPIELSSFWNELNMLLDNIKGNGNYGEAFVREVETVFRMTD